jgi:hypothetical protein
MAPKIRKITHFFRRLPEKGLWLLISFITQDQEGVYHPGYEKPALLDDYRRSCTDERFFNPRVERLDNPIEVDISLDKGDLWMDEKGEIYFSLEENPVLDVNKVLVARPNLEGVINVEDEIISAFKSSSVRLK